MGVTLNSLGIFQKNNQFNHCQHSIKTCPSDWVHGGRQEIQNPDGTWQRKENAKLEKTFGCLRASDEDMKTFKTFTDYLESTDDQETPGKVFVKDDFERFNKKKDE